MRKLFVLLIAIVMVASNVYAAMYDYKNSETSKTAAMECMKYVSEVESGKRLAKKFGRKAGYQMYEKLRNPQGTLEAYLYGQSFDKFLNDHMAVKMMCYVDLFTKASKHRTLKRDRDFKFYSDKVKKGLDESLDQAIKLYNSGEYAKSKKIFAILGDYKDANSYMEKVVQKDGSLQKSIDVANRLEEERLTFSKVKPSWKFLSWGMSKELTRTLLEENGFDCDERFENGYNIKYDMSFESGKIIRYKTTCRDLNIETLGTVDSNYHFVFIDGKLVLVGFFITGGLSDSDVVAQLQPTFGKGKTFLENQEWATKNDPDSKRRHIQRLHYRAKVKDNIVVFTDGYLSFADPKIDQLDLDCVNGKGKSASKKKNLY